MKERGKDGNAEERRREREKNEAREERKGRDVEEKELCGGVDGVREEVKEGGMSVTEKKEN